jgi:hypothetical protein
MTTDSDSPPDQLRCIELVDMVTTYLDGEVSGDQRRRIESISRDAGVVEPRLTNSERLSA